MFITLPHTIAIAPKLKSGKRRIFLTFGVQVGKRRIEADKVGYNNCSFLIALLMDIREVLEFVDQVVYDKTGKRLNDLQRGIIEGTLKRQKYAEIADIYRLSEGHVKDRGYELLQMLSDVFDEPVDKHNLKSVLERKGNLNITFGDNNIGDNNISNIMGYINICSDRPTPTPNKSQPATPDFQRDQYQAKIEMVGKLRQFGLKDEQIAELLGLALEEVKQVDSED